MPNEKLSQNLNEVKKNIAFAALRSGRLPDDVKLIVVTKTENVNTIKEILALGVTDIGENRAQDAVEKFEQLRDVPTWHMIGRLQKNKVKYIVKFCKMIHSVDSFELADVIDMEAKKVGRIIDILIQVNVFSEDSKQGVNPDNVLDLVKDISKLNYVQIKGLMAMAPITDDAQKLRLGFRQMREIRDKILSKNIDNVDMIHLSMGMSQDYEIAVEEGATMVRVGSAIFRT